MKMHIKICKNRNVFVTHINPPWSLMSIFIILKHYFIYEKQVYISISIS